MDRTLQSGRVRERRIVETFVELADTLVEDFDLVEFLSTLTERVVELGMATEAGISLLDEVGDLRFLAASDERIHLLELFEAQNREGPCQECVESGLPVGVTDLEEARLRWPRFTPQALAAGFRSVHAVPLRLRGTVLGAMNLFLNDVGGMVEEDRTVAQAMADVVTISLLQQRELHRAQVVEEQLQHALHSRISIEQAKGILSEQANVPMDVAFELMRGHSRRHNDRLSTVARAVVDGTLTAEDLTGPA